MSKPTDYNMESVRQAYANLKSLRANAKEESVDMMESERSRQYSLGKFFAYGRAVELFLEIFGPCLEE